MGVFDGLRARLDRALSEYDRTDTRARAAGLRDAIIEAKAGVSGMRDGLSRTERELELERRALADAQRRGALADDIADAETSAVAERFANRHAERVQLLEKKLQVQRDELSLAEREVEEMITEFRASRSPGSDGALPGHERAWKDIQSAGGERPGVDLDAELLQLDADRRLHEAAVEAQLQHLKRKLGKRDS